MKLLIFGDIYGRIGRNAFLKEFSALKEKYSPDFSIACVDNISSGRGPIEKHVKMLENVGVDLMTSGDHIFDNTKKITEYLSVENPKLIRPANYYETEFLDIPGVGYRILEKNGKKICVVHLLASNTMRDSVYNPFLKLKEIVSQIDEKMPIVVDFHKEFSADIYGMGFSFDGEISFVYGTHTHLQTNDEMILDNGTGMIGDVGMSGSQFSVIGATLESVQKRFFSGINKGKIEQSLDKRYVLNGVYIEIDDENFKTKKIEKIRINSTL